MQEGKLLFVIIFAKNVQLVTNLVEMHGDKYCKRTCKMKAKYNFRKEIITYKE